MARGSDFGRKITIKNSENFPEICARPALGTMDREPMEGDFAQRMNIFCVVVDPGTWMVQNATIAE
jgi:hypothetical protein